MPHIALQRKLFAVKHERAGGNSRGVAEVDLAAEIVRRDAVVSNALENCRGSDHDRIGPGDRAGERGAERVFRGECAEALYRRAAVGCCESCADVFVLERHGFEVGRVGHGLQNRTGRVAHRDAALAVHRAGNFRRTKRLLKLAVRVEAVPVRSVVPDLSLIHI